MNAGAVTTRLNVGDGLEVPFGVPVTVTRCVPTGVAPVVVMVMVLVQVTVQGLLVCDTDAPVGRPPTVSTTGCAVPETSVRVTVVFPDPPCATVMFPEFESE